MFVDYKNFSLIVKNSVVRQVLVTLLAWQWWQLQEALLIN